MCRSAVDHQLLECPALPRRSQEKSAKDRESIDGRTSVREDKAIARYCTGVCPLLDLAFRNRYSWHQGLDGKRV